MAPTAVDTPPRPLTLPAPEAVLSNPDLVHAILAALADASHDGTLPLQFLAAAATVNPAFRDAAPRVASTLAASTPAPLASLAAAPAMLHGLTHLDLGGCPDAATARAVAVAAAAALRGGAARSLHRITSPRLSTPWLAQADVPALHTVHDATGPWTSARGAGALPPRARALSLVAPAGPCRAPHPNLLARTSCLQHLTLIGFDAGSAAFDAAPPSLAAVALRRARPPPGGAVAATPSVVLPPGHPRLASLTVSFDPPGRPRRRAPPRGAVVALADVSAAARVEIAAPGRTLTVAVPLQRHGDNADPAAADAAALLAEVTASGGATRLDLSADGGVRVGAATPADVAAAAAGWRGVRVEVATEARLVVVVK